MLCVLALAVACQRDYGAVTLNMHVASMTGDDKMAVNNNLTYWTAGDSVWVNGLPYPVSTAGSYSITVASSNTGYRAVSPASIMSGGSTINLPSVYHYRTNSSGNQLLDLPLAAVSDGNSLLFNHLTGAIMVKLRNDTTIALTIDHVTISSNGYAISGSRTINFNDLTSITAARGGTGEDRTVTMYFDRQELTLSPNASAYIMLPVAAVGDTNKFTIKVSSHYQGNRIIFSKTQNSASSFSCNTLGHATMALNRTIARTVRMFDYEGSGANITYLINNKEEFKLMVTAINSGWTHEGNGYSTFKYRITNPIDFGGDTIETIRHYRGASFDGDNNSLSNLKIKGEGKSCALFDTIYSDNNTVIIELLLNNITLISNGDENTRLISPIIGYSSGANTYSNCTVNSINIIINNSPTGDIYFGGIVAATGSAISFNNCHFNSNVTLSSNGKLYYGGMLGAMVSTNNVNCSITSCSDIDTNHIQLTANGDIYAGGLIGEAKKLMNTIEDQTSLLKITINSNRKIIAGGLVGLLDINTSNIFTTTNSITTTGYISFTGTPTQCLIGTIYGKGKRYNLRNNREYTTTLIIPNPDNPNNIYTGNPTSQTYP